MLQKMNTQQDLKSYTKDEPTPKFITPALESYYEQTDLTLRYVYDCCLVLKPLKGIDVNEQQVQFWYIEFIKMGWKKKDFDKQFETIKRATLYNRIDFENWLSTGIMYNEIDFRVRLSQEIDAKIQKGNFLKNQKIELTPEENKMVELSVSKELEMQHKNRRYEIMEEKMDELKKAYLENLSAKKRKVALLGLKEKMEITNKLFETGKIQGKAEGFLYQTTLYNLEDFSDLIEDNCL